MTKTEMKIAKACADARAPYADKLIHLVTALQRIEEASSADDMRAIARKAIADVQS